MTLIDLDTAPAPAPERVRRIPWRRFRVAAATVVLLLLGGAAAPVEVTVFPRVTDTGGRGSLAFLLTPTVLYTAHEGANIDDGIEVVARPLTGGAPLWEATVLQVISSDGIQLEMNGAVLLVWSEGTLAVLDPATGRERWPASDWSGLRVVGNRVVLQDFDETDAVRLADVETGKILWTRRGGVADAALDPTGRYLVVLGLDDKAQVRSAADGRVLASRSIDDVINPDAPSFAVIGDRLYVLGAVSLTAFRLPGLTPVWPVPAPVRLSSAGVTTCGDLLCVTGDTGITAIDPVTGKQRWNSSEWLGYHPGDVAQAHDGRIAVLDPETGRVIRRLGRGTTGGGLMLRAAGTSTQVSDLRTGEVYGTLTDALPYGCTVAGEFIACSVNGALTVFRTGW